MNLIDRRYKSVRLAMDKAYPQMVSYFAARYSWGQPCDPMRAKDWAYLGDPRNVPSKGRRDPLENLDQISVGEYWPPVGLD